MVGPETLALAGCHCTDFVSPGVAVGTLELDPPCPGMGRDAAVFPGSAIVVAAAPPPLPTCDGVGQEVAGHALARTHQLSDGLGAPAGSVCDVTSGTQLPTAQLRGTIRKCTG